MKQTTVEWFINQLEQKGDASVNVSIGRMQIFIKEEDYNDLFKQAKEMEEQQKDKFAVDFTEWLNEIKVIDNQTYYNNTLGELLEIYKKEKYGKLEVRD